MFILDPGSASKNLSIFNPKIVSKLSEIWSGMFIPDPDLIPDHWVKKAPDPGSATLKKPLQFYTLKVVFWALWPARDQDSQLLADISGQQLSKSCPVHLL